ncbi:hypothetical protein [Teichococcus aestuarii]|uniref:hypothetical protein n=1 Tax=Teichococcus aestuarii TaxID=568898 RepID=UPI00360BAF92
MSILSEFLPRPAPSPENLRRAGSIEAPLIALFDSSVAAGDALRSAGATLWREASPGVVILAPLPGLREKLYAAGAMLVVG